MKKIMIDPGHAGYYYNKSPVNDNYYESRAMWELANYLANALIARGFYVGMTRDSIQLDPELTYRGRLAKGFDAFISLHSNAASNANADAPWLIHYSSDDLTGIDEESKKLAHALGPVISELMGVSAPYYYTKACDFDRDGDGRVGDEYYGVLFGAKSVGVPGLIIEHSFHTNAKAAKWLLSDKNLMALAEAEADALAKYYGMEEPMTASERKEFESLEEKVAKLEKELAKLNNAKIQYNWTLACPKWAQATVHKLHQKKILEGDEKGQLRLTEDMCRILVMLDRKGLFD